MTKLLAILLLLSAICGSCKFRAQSSSVNDKNEFEGIITYKIGFGDAKADSGAADTLKIFYAHGNVLKLYNSKMPSAVKKDLYLVKENKVYTQVGNSDTLLWYNVANNSVLTLLSINETDTSKKFLGYDCSTVHLVEKFNNKGISYKTYNNYTYSKSVLQIEAARFRDYNFSFMNQIFDKAGHYYLHFDMYTDHGIGKKTFDAIKIENKELDPRIFDISNKKLKELRF